MWLTCACIHQHIVQMLIFKLFPNEHTLMIPLTGSTEFCRSKTTIIMLHFTHTSVVMSHEISAFPCLRPLCSACRRVSVARCKHGGRSISQCKHRTKVAFMWLGYRIVSDMKHTCSANRYYSVAQGRVAVVNLSYSLFFLKNSCSNWAIIDPCTAVDNNHVCVLETSVQLANNFSWLLDPYIMMGIWKNCSDCVQSIVNVMGTNWMSCLWNKPVYGKKKRFSCEIWWICYCHH